MYKLINYSSFVNWLAVGISVLALLYFRWKRPNAHRPIRVLLCYIGPDSRAECCDELSICSRAYFYNYVTDLHGVCCAYDPRPWPVSRLSASQIPRVLLVFGLTSSLRLMGCIEGGMSQRVICHLSSCAG